MLRFALTKVVSHPDALRKTSERVQQDELITITVKGKLGLNVEPDTGRILSVIPGGQAEKLGLLVGITIHRIDKGPFSKSTLIEKVGTNAPFQLRVSSEGMERPSAEPAAAVAAVFALHEV